MIEPSETITAVGCGDLGRRLATILSPTRYRCLGLRRNIPATDTAMFYRQADFHCADNLAAALPDPCPVVVLTLTPAAYDDEAYRTAYVEGSRNLVAALGQRSLAPRLVLFVSSTSVYGENAGEWVDEMTPAVPRGFSGQRLLEAEQLLLESGLPVLILRCSGIYGPGRQRLLQNVWQSGATSTSADSFTNRIHAQDCASAIAHLIQRRELPKPQQQVYLASDCRPAPASEVRAWLAQQLGVPTVPYKARHGGLAGKRCRNQRLLDSGFDFQYPDYRDGYAPLVSEFLRQQESGHE